jgi:hypothetical protein
MISVLHNATYEIGPDYVHEEVGIPHSCPWHDTTIPTITSLLIDQTLILGTSYYIIEHRSEVPTHSRIFSFALVVSEAIR